jgi:hypothetical protein
MGEYGMTTDAKTTSCDLGRARGNKTGVKSRGLVD